MRNVRRAVTSTIASSTAASGTVTARTTGRHSPAPRTHSAMTDPASRRFNPTMTTAATHASDRTQPRLANGPIRTRSFVKWISGIMANGNCMLRITWLMISNPKLAFSPTTAMVMAAGATARARVIRRRIHGLMRKLRKPSITI